MLQGMEAKRCQGSSIFGIPDAKNRAFFMRVVIIMAGSRRRQGTGGVVGVHWCAGPPQVTGSKT